MNSNSPSMRDVALRAGVSVATVSHVLNDTRYVTESTRKKVMDSIKELGYYPNATARILKTGKRNLIGIIVPDISNPDWASIIEAVSDVLAQDNYRLIIVNSKENPENELENIRILVSGVVDGFIIASTLTDYRPIQETLPENFPLVFVDRRFPDCPYDSIVAEDANVMYRGVERLILNGHKRIGYIAGLMRLSTSLNRLAAYKNALKDYKIPMEENFLQYSDSMTKSSIPLCQILLEEKCTAIVASNNVILDDILFYMSEKSLVPGKDLALLGYGLDGHPNFLSKQMDLIVQPSIEIGKKAGEQIIRRIQDSTSPIQNVVLYSSLLTR